MIKVTITIERSVKVVWDYFTKPESWSKWYGGGLKGVEPSWQKGGKLLWALGGSSPISNIVPYSELYIVGDFMDVTYKFIKKSEASTTVEIIESDPKGGASFNDGGAANKARWETVIRKLKECIESETVNETPKVEDKKWWQFWK